MEKFDIAIVGSGSGLVVLEAALEAGLRCAIVEQAKFGGTCLNKGCIPTKMLTYPADLIRETAHAKRAGVTFANPKVDWAALSARVWGQIDLNHEIEHELNQAENLKVYHGAGAFTGAHTMQVQLEDGSSEEFEAERFVLAAGARSLVPPIKGIEEAGYLTSESFFGSKFPKRPWKSLVIIGGGPIGVEFAHIFSALGTKVTLVQLADRLLTPEEPEISLFVERQFTENGISVFTSAMAVSAERRGTRRIVTVQRTETKELFTVEGEEILVASGVRSNADRLAPDKANVQTNAKGWIETNEYLETSAPNIWALGDINGKYQFRHKANYEAEILSRNLFSGGEKQRACYRAVPWAVFTDPQVGHVGMTEREARDAGLHYHVGVNHYSSVVAGRKMGYSAGDADDGFVKIVVGDDKRLLGVHIVGPHAAILVQPFVYLMNAGVTCAGQGQGSKGAQPSFEIHGLRAMCPAAGTYEPIANSMVIHPSLSELTAWALEQLQ